MYLSIGQIAFAILLLQLSIIFSKSNSEIVRHVFEINYARGSPDGVRKQNILKINGLFPGPTIRATIGDTLQIDVINLINDRQSTTLHWHGLYQKSTPFEDGPAMITQCPLKYGQTQRYEFKLEQSGTYWYHGHLQSQYSEGLWGVLIIQNKPEVYKYDDEIVITLNDWYYQTAKENEDWYLSPISDGVPPYPDTIMINGRGRYPCNIARLQNRSCAVNNQRRPVFQIRVGRTYRIRVINTSSRASYDFSIDDHILQTIEVDGVDVARPVFADIASISPGQRYSFLITANKSLDRYLIRAAVQPLVILGENINRFPEALFPEVTAVLQYVRTGNNNQTRLRTELHDYTATNPPRNPNQNVILNEALLAPYDRFHAPSFFDQEFVLFPGFQPDDQGVQRASFNSMPFQMPQDKPLLLSMLDNESIPESAFPLQIQYLNVIQIVINTQLGSHPVHLHGHVFWVLGKGQVGDGQFNPNIHKLSLSGPKRDTLHVPENSWAVIRFLADNPGVWTFHCHIDWHSLAGMRVTFIEAEDVARRTLKVTNEARRLCRT